MDSKQHLNDVLNNHIAPMFEAAREKLDALQPGEKIPATELAKEVGKEFGMTGPQVYPILLLFFQGYPEIDVKRGAKGGLYKKAKTTPSPVV